MATKLEKNITRESTIQIDGKEIMITLTADQGINLKLKGLRKGAVDMPIENLYNQLTGRVTNEPKKEEKKSLSVSRTNKVTKKNPMISLYDLRSHNAISTLDVATLSKFDQIIKSLIDAMKHEK